MSFNDPTAGVFVFLVVMLVNRVLAEKALKRLTAEDKSRLLDSFSDYRIYGLLVLVILTALFLVAAKAFPHLRLTFIWGLFGLVVLHSIAIMLLSFAKLKKLDIPVHYVNNYVVRSCLQFVALIFLFFTFMTRYFAY
jgi:hypothetical protein